MAYPSDKKSLITHFITDLSFAGDKVCRDVVVTLWSGDFDFPDF